MNSVLKILRLSFFMALLGLLLNFSAAEAQDVSGVMMVVKGDVKIIAKDGKVDLGKVGKKVTAGDTVTAGADARAKIVMADKNVLNISPDSKIVIEKYENDGKDKKNVELNVVYGKVRASVEQKYDGEKNKFNVKTPSAVAGVRGTDFITSYNPVNKVSQVITFSGTVAFGQAGPAGSIRNAVFVQPGQMTQLGGQGAAPEPPKNLPKEDLNKANSETKADLALNSSKSDGTTKTADKNKGKKETPAAGEIKEPRAPANTTVSMTDSADLGTAPVAGNPAMSSPVGLLPRGGNIITPTQSTFLNDAILNNQKSKVQIILKPQ